MKIKVTEQEVCIAEQRKEIDELHKHCDSSDRVSRQRKVILNYSAFNTNSANYQVTVKRVIKDALKLPDGLINQIAISKFGRSTSTVLLDLPSLAARFTIFERKSKLRTNETYKYLYINEFLTKRNAELMKQARKRKKEKRLHSVFTLNGQVYVKRSEGGEKQLILNVNDLDNPQTDNQTEDLESDPPVSETA